MGSSSSKKRAAGPPPQRAQPVDHGPLPMEITPYTGPIIQHHIVQMNITFRPHVQLNFLTPGMSQMSTNVDDYYPTLGAQYGQGFVLISFYRVPGGGQRQGGFLSYEMAVPFQGIFSRCYNMPSPERWQLRIEKSVMFVHAMVTARIFKGSASQSSAGTSHLIDMIAQVAAGGGRLICVELTGTMSTQAMQVGFTRGSVTSGVGVDLFFNMPLHPNPVQYIYMCVCAPIPIHIQAGFAQVNVDIQFDFMAQLSAYLNQGYRLVEVFYDSSSTTQQQGMMSAGVSMNSIWFFEKEASKANDNMPVYEGCIVEYYLKISAGFQGTTAHANWAPLLERMGHQGWELACTLETPKTVRTGMFGVQQTILLFFQRRLNPGNAGPPVGHAGPPVGHTGPPVGHTGPPVGLVDPATGQPITATSTAPPSYDKVVGE